MLFERLSLVDLSGGLLAAIERRRSRLPGRADSDVLFSPDVLVVQKNWLSQSDDAPTERYS